MSIVPRDPDIFIRKYESRFDDVNRNYIEKLIRAGLEDVVAGGDGRDLLIRARVPEDAVDGLKNVLDDGRVVWMSQRLSKLCEEHGIVKWQVNIRTLDDNMWLDFETEKEARDNLARLIAGEIVTYVGCDGIEKVVFPAHVSKISLERVKFR